MDERRIKETALAMLEGGRAVLSIPGAWTQNSYAKNIAGDDVMWNEDEAVCFCARGAIRAIESRLSAKARKLDAAAYALGMVEAEVPGRMLIAFNDRADSVSPVLDAFDRAISRLKQELAG